VLHGAVAEVIVGGIGRSAGVDPGEGVGSCYAAELFGDDGYVGGVGEVPGDGGADDAAAYDYVGSGLDVHFGWLVGSLGWSRCVGWLLRLGCSFFESSIVPFMYSRSAPVAKNQSTYIATQLHLTYLNDMSSDGPFDLILVASMSAVTLRSQLRRGEWQHF